MQEELLAINQQLKLVNEKLDLLLQNNQSNEGEEKNDPISAKQAAAYLKLSLSRVYCLICEGKLKPLQRTKYKRILFTKELLNEYLK